jgi:hypothetical protein
MVRKPATIPDIITNKDGLYEGDLVSYYKALFFQAQNLRHPYHNLRHMLHVFWLCYEACVFYGDRLSKRQVRNLLIAALFHDFDHSGMFGNDDLNIERAVRGLRKHLAHWEEFTVEDIIEIMRATEFPHKTPSGQLDLPAQILRDADVSQALSVAWLQQIVIGLASEWGKPPLEVLKAQRGFHRSLSFQTEWARSVFPPELLEAKIAEAQAHLDILESQ